MEISELTKYKMLSPDRKSFLFVLLITHISWSLGLCLHSFSEILDHLYYYYSELFFRQIVYLHLVVLGFYLVLSSGTYFSAISFCLSVYVVSFPQAAGL